MSKTTPNIEYRKPTPEEMEILEEKTKQLGDEPFTRRKWRVKVIRTLGEILIVALGLYLLANLFFTFKNYTPYPEELAAENTDSANTGFVALSYFGVERIGDTATLIGKKELREHLTELKRQGYVTIGQQDIIDYYKEDKPLPPRALYLMFEDGRRDTAIFAEEIMEDLNYKATMMTYPEKFDNHDPKFLLPKELKDMEAMTFWEMGTNGYRLQYINVFDRYNRYLGEIDPLRYAMVHDYLGRKYNHFLMDYIRDKDGIPKESYRHMRDRVSYDYTHLKDVYQDNLGYVPGVHVLMHANTGRFGNNPDVSAINERWIREMFAVNFNREGYCLNQKNSSIYDLTRMQPQPYWPVNHLLMRIKYDISQPIEFIQGDTERQADWELLKGASEIKKESLILTTLPEDRAVARIAGRQDFQNFMLTTTLEGNAFGEQSIYLRADEGRHNYIRVALISNYLVVSECTNGVNKELYREKIPVILGEPILSKEEDKRDAEVRENEAFARYATSPAMMQEYASRAKEAGERPVATVEEGAEPYDGVQSFHRRGKHDLSIELEGDRICVKLDGKDALTDGTVGRTEAGGLCLVADWKSEAWSQRNLADDVYDAVFNHLHVTALTGKADRDDEEVLYSLKYTGWDKVKYQAEQYWEAILRWFLNYL